jgi:hypothetical protein
MRYKTAILAALAIGAGSLKADVYVNGHTRSDGTYVSPHYRSSPNGTTYDNWSTRGNTNPYTGERGTRDPYNNSPQHYRSGSAWQQWGQ